MSTNVSTFINLFDTNITTSMSTRLARGIRKMSEKTKLFLADRSKLSLRTTIPISIVKQWDLTKDDYLDWSWEIHKGEQVMIVRKSGVKK